MIEVGKYNKLKAARREDHGWYLVDEAADSVLLPMKWVPLELEEDSEIEVFVYRDSEDRIIATTMKPIIVADQFANLLVKDVTKIGAFVDVGLEKDLLIPFGEQHYDVEVGKRYVTHMYVDCVTDRLTGSTKLQKFFTKTGDDFEVDQKVKGLVYKETDIGYKVIVDNSAGGLVYKNQIFSKVNIGDELDLYVKNIREDGKMDLMINKGGYETVEPVTQQIIDYLNRVGGFSPLNDKTDPKVIYDVFGISKKQFKKALGALYKDKKILLEKDGITLL